MRARRFPLLFVVAASALLHHTITSAGADCAGPTISHRGGEVRRGTTLTVVGSFWGDSCYDTGPPPDGEGSLGAPLGEIEVLVSQGDAVVVARGSAHADYGFEVDITIPGTLRPGPVEVIARGKTGAAVNATEAPLVVSTEPALTDDQAVATFGPVSTAAAEDEIPVGPITAAVGVVAASLALVIRARRRSAERRAGSAATRCACAP